MSKQLTEHEENLIKDILKVIGNDEVLNKQFAKGVGMTERRFDAVTDRIFKKLGNGRVTVVS